MELFKAKYIFTNEDLSFALRNFPQFCTLFLSISMGVLNDSNPLIPPLAQCLGRRGRVMDKTNWSPGKGGPCFNKEIVRAIQKVMKVFFVAIIYEKNLSVCVLRIRLIILGSYHWETVTFLPADFLFFPPLRILLSRSA